MRSVAYGPDGTLFATAGDELWAYPAGGGARILADRWVDPTIGYYLDVSSDGQWLSVSGREQPTLYKVGALTPGAAAERDALLPGWEKYNFPELSFYGRTCFTGDSGLWVGRTQEDGFPFYFRCWRLPGLARFVYEGFPETEEYEHLEAVPGTSHIVTECGSRYRGTGGIAFWCGDLARPDDPVTTPIGAVQHCNRFRIGSDGRFFVSSDTEVRIYSVRDGEMNLDSTVPLLLPHFGMGLTISLSADARRLVARGYLSKLVCAVETEGGEVLGPWDWGIGQVNDAAIAPDGLTAAAAGSSKKLVVWDLDR